MESSPGSAPKPIEEKDKDTTTETEAPLPPVTKLIPKHAFGCNPMTMDSILSYTEESSFPKAKSKHHDKQSAQQSDYRDRLIFKVGRKVCIFDPESGKQVCLYVCTSALHLFHIKLTTKLLLILQEFLKEKSAPRTKNHLAKPSDSVDTDSADGTSIKTPIVYDVLHFALCSNAFYLSVCELAKDPNKGTASSISSAATAVDGRVFNSTMIPQISVYAVATGYKLKTLNHPSQNASTLTVDRPIFVGSTFCGGDGNKLLAALTVGGAEREVIVWLWEKEKLSKVFSIASNITVLRSAPACALMLTVSGTGTMKYLALAGDNNLKSGVIMHPGERGKAMWEKWWKGERGRERGRGNREREREIEGGGERETER